MSVLNVVLPLCSSLVSFVFAALVLFQWRRRRRNFQLVWGIGLLWYGISAGTEFLGGAFGWSQPLYRAWYLIGALYVAAWLGAGTVYLLNRTGFGYFAAFSLLFGGLISLAATKEYPGSQTAAYVTLAGCIVAAAGLVYAAAWRRDLTGHIAFAALAVGSLAVAVLVLTARIAAPGYALDPVTHVPVGSAVPNYLRVVTPAFNIAGAFWLVFGAVYSAYVYMPKRKLLRADAVRTPVLDKLWYVLVVAVNLVVSLPGAGARLFAGRLNSRVPATMLIALGGFIPGVTSGLNRFGFTWSFFLGELLGVALIFAGFLVSEEVFAGLRVMPGRRPVEVAPG